MRCRHHKIRRNKRSDRCLLCGAKRPKTIETIPPSHFREYLPGLKSIDKNGVVLFDLIDITTSHSYDKVMYGRWKRRG